MSVDEPLAEHATKVATKVQQTYINMNIQITLKLSLQEFKQGASVNKPHAITSSDSNITTTKKKCFPNVGHNFSLVNSSLVKPFRTKSFRTNT
jgi:hypothetical protein